MQNLSFLTHLLMILSTAFVIYLLYRATGRSRLFIFLILLWTILISFLGYTGFYRQADAVPPRFLFLVAPGVLTVLLMLVTPKGRKLIDSFPLSHLTLLHIVRFPVELMLYQLYAATLVPQIMTFEGNNFDIVTGLTAPLVFYLYFRCRLLGVKWLLAWNFLGLGLLLTIMFIAIMSSPTPFQQFAFEQPNIGVTYFPFVWLPGIIVPAALFAHIVSIRQLLVYSLYRTKGSSDDDSIQSVEISGA